MSNRPKRMSGVDPYRYWTIDNFQTELNNLGISDPSSFSRSDLKLLLEANRSQPTPVTTSLVSSYSTTSNIPQTLVTSTQLPATSSPIIHAINIQHSSQADVRPMSTSHVSDNQQPMQNIISYRPRLISSYPMQIGTNPTTSLDVRPSMTSSTSMTQNNQASIRMLTSDFITPTMTSMQSAVPLNGRSVLQNNSARTDCANDTALPLHSMTVSNSTNRPGVTQIVSNNPFRFLQPNVCTQNVQPLHYAAPTCIQNVQASYSVPTCTQNVQASLCSVPTCTQNVQASLCSVPTCTQNVQVSLYSVPTCTQNVHSSHNANPCTQNVQVPNCTISPSTHNVLAHISTAANCTQNVQAHDYFASNCTQNVQSRNLGVPDSTHNVQFRNPDGTYFQQPGTISHNNNVLSNISAGSYLQPTAASMINMPFSHTNTSELGGQQIGNNSLMQYPMPISSQPINHKCCHGDLSLNERNKAWLKPGTKVYEKLTDIILSKQMIKDIPRLSGKQQTSCVEGYHSVVNHFAPKMIGFSYKGMVCRLKLAALHFNENNNKDQAVTKDGIPRYRIVFPKFKNGDFSVRKIDVDCTFHYVNKLRSEVFSSGKTPMNEESIPPPLCSTFERPQKNDAVASFCSRFK